MRVSRCASVDARSAGEQDKRYLSLSCFASWTLIIRKEYSHSRESHKMTKRVLSLSRGSRESQNDNSSWYKTSKDNKRVTSHKLINSLLNVNSLVYQERQTPISAVSFFDKSLPLLFHPPMMETTFPHGLAQIASKYVSGLLAPSRCLGAFLRFGDKC